VIIKEETDLRVASPPLHRMDAVVGRNAAASLLLCSFLNDTQITEQLSNSWQLNTTQVRDGFLFAERMSSGTQERRHCELPHLSSLWIPRRDHASQKKDPPLITLLCSLLLNPPSER
jgi:hypothetical protein